MAWGFSNTGGGTGLQTSDAMLRVSALAGSIVEISKGTIHKADAGHENIEDPNIYDYYFVIHESQFDPINPWTIRATNGSLVVEDQIIINASDEYDVILSFLPVYTYDGDSELLDDGNGNWRLKLLTSGTLNFSQLITNVDIFAVGGGGGGNSSIASGAWQGGGGGGGGYTTTVLNQHIVHDSNYSVSIGAGGATRTNGGVSKLVYLANNDTLISANGGIGSTVHAQGSDGGSGGGDGTNNDIAGAGGSDGSNGYGSGSSGSTQPNGGVGQGTTTREFGELTGALYAGGGGGGTSQGNSHYGAGGEGGGGDGASASAGHNSTAGGTNTGGGGGACSGPSSGGYGGQVYRGGKPGGSGIIIIRNRRHT